MTIGERIYNLLEERNISRKEFSLATGIPLSTINDWKRKNNSPSSDRILKICEVLSVSPYELLQEASTNTQFQTDYLIVSAGTDRYDLLIEFDKLNAKQKERVYGFISALAFENKEDKRE